MPYFFVFFFNDTATTEIYTLSLHDALPISAQFPAVGLLLGDQTNPQISLRPAGGYIVWQDNITDGNGRPQAEGLFAEDRKSTRLNSSHVRISYAVFCLKKKKSL